MSGKPCVAYEVDVEHRESYDPKSQARRDWKDHWHHAGTDRGFVRFVVEDASGEAVVAVTQETTHVLPGDAEYLSVGDDRKRVLRFLSRQADTRLIRDHDFRYREWCLEEGAHVVVVGHVGTRSATSGAAKSGYRDTAHRVELVGSASEPLLVTDRRELIGDTGASDASATPHRDGGGPRS